MDMSVMLLMAHTGKKISLKLKNGFHIEGCLKSFSSSGLFVESGREFLYFKNDEIQSVNPC